MMYTLNRTIHITFSVICCILFQASLYSKGLLSEDPWRIVTVDDQEQVSSYCSLAMDSEDHPHISYSRYSQSTQKTNLYYAVFDGSVWHIELVDDNDDVGHHSDLALDDSGYPHIAYWDLGMGTLRYAWRESSGWQIEVPDNKPGVGQYPSICIDAVNRVHLSYYGFYEGLKYACRERDVWTFENVDMVSSQFLGTHTSMALDSGGKPHIAYYGGHADYSIKYARKTDDLWQVFTLDAAQYLNSPSIALDPFDRVHITYSNWSIHQLNHAFQLSPGSEFEIEYLWPGINKCLVINDRQLHLIWGSEDLRYATKFLGDSTWEHETVDSDKDSGAGADLKVDGRKGIHIAYQQGWIEELRYAWKPSEMTATPTATPSSLPSSTVTHSPTPTATLSPIPSATFSPSPVPSASQSPSPTCTMTASPDPTITGTPTPETSATPGQDTVYIDLLMPAPRFSEGDHCKLDLFIFNPNQDFNADLYVLLEVFGTYMAFPSWEDIRSGVDYLPVYLTEGFSGNLNLIPGFTMPDVSPMGPLFFHACLFEPGTLSPETLLSNWSWIEFWLE
jgi:hypothetical protein